MITLAPRLPAYFKRRPTYTIPNQDYYTFSDLGELAQLACNQPIPSRSLDYWVEQAGITQKGWSTRTSQYTLDDIKTFAVYLGFKLNCGRNEAYPAYINYLEGN